MLFIHVYFVYVYILFKFWVWFGCENSDWFNKISVMLWIFNGDYKLNLFDLVWFIFKLKKKNRTTIEKPTNNPLIKNHRPNK